ncbi:MAG TPA: hypothetical protein VGL65_06470 [Gemmatimonadales bacterium]|jgi:hypothetical protein
MLRTPVRYALAVAALLVTGCGGPLPTAPSAPASQAASAAPKPSDNLVLSIPLPTLRLPGPLASLGCALEGSVGVDIGPNGGTITLGATSLVIPKHALSQLTHIVMLPALGKTVAVQFFPEGLTFSSNAPPTLTFNTDCIGNPSNDQIVYTDDAGNILERLTTTSRTAHTISAQIHHFSRYAVAW